MTAVAGNDTGKEKYTSPVHGNKKESTGMKILFILGHGATVLGLAYLMLNPSAPSTPATGESAGGWGAIVASVRDTMESYIRASTGDVVIRATLVGCMAGYWLRMTLMSLVWQERGMALNEVLGVGSFVVWVHGTYAYCGAASKDAGQGKYYAGLALYLLGSYLNTWSEVDRCLWKKDKRNKGKLYTQGLWRYSMHINYFGDLVLFSGMALVANNLVCMLPPLMMHLGFVYQHIPDLDKYLADRYPGEFPAYSMRTKKLIPFVY